MLAEAVARDEADTLLEELEQGMDDDFDLGGFRERRLTEMRKQSVYSLSYSLSHPTHLPQRPRVQQNQLLAQSDHGKYTEYKNEKDLIAASA